MQMIGYNADDRNADADDRQCLDFRTAQNFRLQVRMALFLSSTYMKVLTFSV